MTSRLFACSFAALALIATFGCKGETDVVTVNGEPVTMDEFNQYISTKRTVRVVVQGQVVEVPVAETLGFQALQELATQRIVMHMAADEGLLPTDAEVEEEMKFRTALNQSYIKELTAAGYTLGQIRQEVKYSLSEERLLTRGISVEMAEVEELIKNNPDQFMEQAMIDVYQIFALSEDRKKLVDTELRSSQSFKAVAAKYNQDPSGERRQLPVDGLQEPLKSLLGPAKPGTVTDWVQTGSGWRRFYVEARTEKKAMDLSPERKEYIRRQLALSYGRQANDLARKVADRLRSSDVAVSEDEAILKDMWKRFEDRLEKTADDEKKANVQVSPDN